jgi:hypothetical protein
MIQMGGADHEMPFGDATSSRVSMLDRLHLGTIVLVGLPTPIAWYGLAGALLLACIQPGRTLTSLRTLLRSPLLVLWIAWWAWMALSMTWAPEGATLRVEPFIMLLLIPAMAPLRRHATAVVWCLGIGLFANLIVQVLEWTGLMTDARYGPWYVSGGLEDYPAFTAAFCTVVLVLLLPLLPGTSPRWRIAAGTALAVGCLAGVLLSGSKIVLVAGGGAIAMLCLIMLLRRNDRTGYMLLAGLLLMGTGGITWVALDEQNFLNHRFAMLAKQFRATTGGQARRLDDTSMDTSAGLRVLWWNAAISIVKESPAGGFGAGSTRGQLARVEERLPQHLGAGIDGFISIDPHSTIGATAIEQGLVGLALLFGTALTAAWVSIRAVLRDLRHTGPLAAWCVLGAVAVVHTLQFSPWMTALGSILVLQTLWIARPLKPITPHN